MQLNFDAKTLSRIQQLIEGNFTGRDELLAAAKSLDDESRVRICRRLADHLAANAVELQQIVAASGETPAGPLDLFAVAESLFDFVRLTRGARGVLETAVEGEENLTKEYDQAIETTKDPNAESILRKQREEIAFGKEVLENVKPPKDKDADGD